MTRALTVVLLGLYAAYEALRTWTALHSPPPGLETEPPMGYYAAVGLVSMVLFALAAFATAHAHPSAPYVAAISLGIHTVLLWAGAMAFWRSPESHADAPAQAGLTLVRAAPVLLLLLASRLERLYQKRGFEDLEDSHE
ncbi:MAG: hypothetical protein RMM31_07580 [Anaerolineae bacterium]|nr:hypothetical protein [Thermoflexales bacterium]MDW8396088.1 hypothetical protein [Anaerolineae bacterium]